jgi:cellobiose-specific phosphotransferase system component IIA
MTEDGDETPVVTQALLVSKVQAAKREMTEAEADIERLLRELRAKAIEEKTTISFVLEAAFDKLRSARGNVEALEELIATKGAAPGREGQG